MRLAEDFRARTGKLPVRLDWRGENRTYWETQHGVAYPSARIVELEWGGWSKFMLALGGLPLTHRETGVMALEYVQARYPEVELMPGANGTVDCFIGGERVEVKGSRLNRDARIPAPRWRFRIHSRQLSLLVDRVILVGIAGDSPVVEWSFDRADSLIHLDGKDALSVTARQVFGGGHYPYYYNEVFREDLTYEELLAMESSDE
jgi:hypothetical protein